MTSTLAAASYLGAAIFFIFSLGGLSHPATSRRGNLYGILGMTVAVMATLFGPRLSSSGLPWVLAAMMAGGAVGIFAARMIRMTQMPELVAAMHSLVGLAAVLVGFANYIDPGSSAQYTGSAHSIHELEICLGVLIGAVTLSGSVIAFGKLSGRLSGRPVLLPGRHWLNLGALVLAILAITRFIGADPSSGIVLLVALTVISLAFGVHMVMAIGGADMPVVVSMLNSYSGWAAAATGFMLYNDLLIVTGALVGSSGAILSYIMCRAMNRRFLAVIAGGFGTEGGPPPKPGDEEQPKGTVVAVTAAETAEMLRHAKKVIIVPGYGMAVAQAQHRVSEITAHLRAQNIDVRFGIHPVAGRMPGHMNVLLAEARVPYDIVFEMEEINEDLPEADVALVIGANDIVNPAAEEDPHSPLAGMPVLQVWKAHNSIMMKRSMASGYAGVDNPLMWRENNRMLFGDARKTLDEVYAALRA